MSDSSYSYSLGNHVKKIIVQGCYTTGKIINDEIVCNEYLIENEEELFLWAEEVYEEINNNDKADSVERVVKGYKINVAGSREAVKQLGKHLIALAYEDTPEGYYDYFEELGFVENKVRCRLVVHGNTRVENCLKQSKIGSEDKIDR